MGKEVQANCSSGYRRESMVYSHKQGVKSPKYQSLATVDTVGGYSMIQ